MATTTTIYADKDNWLYEAFPTFQYGNGAFLKIGVAGGAKKMTGIFEFDVSAITKPSDVVSAIFSLTEISSGGWVSNTITLARLSQDFTESTSNWNTYDGSNAWASAGAESDAELTEQTYTFDVVDGDVSVDIKELVVDAINRRSGVLRFICFYSGTPSSTGLSTFDSRTSGGGNYPEVAIKVADRIVWNGSEDGNLSSGKNWDGDVKPTSNDHALFVTNGASAPSTGTITCSHCYFGKQFSSDVGSSANSIAIAADKVFVDTKAQLYLNVSADEVRIRGAKRIVDGCVIRGTVADVYIMGCESEVRVEGNANFTNIFVMSGSKLDPAMGTTEGVVSQVILDDRLSGATVLCEGGFNIEDNGESVDVSLFGGGKYVLNNTSEVDGVTNLTIASGSVCYFNAKEIQTDLMMYGGTFTLEDNKNSQLDMPTSITAHGSKINLQSGLDSANATAFSGTTFMGTNAQITLGKSVTITPSA